MTRTGRAAVAVVALVALVAGSAVWGLSEDRNPGAGHTRISSSAQRCTRDLLACARESSLRDLIPAHPRRPTGRPIVLGMINQENTPVANFPELSQATQTAVDFVNRDLGGIDGRPVEVRVCNTKFTPEGSTGCAQQFVQDHVAAVLGGIDVFGTGIATLADNGIPYVGGIPVSTASVTARNSFQWSGGTWGATVAFASYAARTLHAERVAILYGEFEPITDSARYGERTLHRLGVDDVQLIPYPITATDISSAVEAAAGGDPDAVFVLAADTGCKPAFDAVHTAGIEATTFYVGACAVPEIIADAGPGKTNGAIFNVEGEIDREHPDPDFTLYSAVVEKYGRGLDPVGAGTVTFRSFMNLYRVMVEIGASRISPTTVTATLRAQQGAPSFSGHPSTCDGKQIAGLPALCSPQQILAVMRDGELSQIGTWVDVGKEYGDGSGQGD